MRTGTLVFLAVIVGVLGFLYLERSEELDDAGGLHAVRHPLFVGFAPQRVSRVRIDNLERGVQLALERDRSGAWFLTDPIAYPALDDLVRTLLQTLSSSLGEPDAGVELGEVKLEPPLIVVTIQQADEGGPREFTLEIGAVDLDPALVYVRVPGHAVGPGVFRAPRTIYNTLDRNPEDFRERRATHLRGNQVTSFRRRGRAFVESAGVEVDLDLDALLEPDGWKRVDPPVVTLDPRAIQLLCRGAAELRVLYFIDDQPASMADYGLDPARFTIELLDERGEPTTLHFGFPEEVGPGIRGTDGWFCRRAGFPHVWEVDPRDVELLIRPAADLYDYGLVRALREDISRVDLEAGGRVLVLERLETGWTVGYQADASRYPASPGEVEDVLAALEATQLGDYPDGVAFDGEEPPMSITVLTKAGVRWGGRIGKPWRDAGSGSPGRLFLRHGDELTGWIEESVAALCTLSPEDLRSRDVHRIDEFKDEVRWIKLRREGRELAYVRTNDTDWVSGDNQVAAPDDFVQCLDELLNVQAEEWLAASPGELTDKVVVEVSCASRPGTTFTLGRDAEGRALCLENGLAAVIDPRVEAYDRDLIDSLVSLFGP